MSHGKLLVHDGITTGIFYTAVIIMNYRLSGHGTRCAGPEELVRRNRQTLTKAENLS
jgi:hypothetical protein